MCVKESKWKGSKARHIGAGFKLYYHGVGVILKEEHNKIVVEVKRA